jgi:hypothetical protein
MGKHSSAVTRSSKKRRPVYLTAVGVLVVSVGAVFLVRSFGSQNGAGGLLGGGSCNDPVQVSLSTTPELQSQLESAAKTLGAKHSSDAPCLQFTISAASPQTVAQSIVSGSDSRPDLWVPDSSLWVSRADDGQSIPTIAVPSIATSPLVLVGQSSNFANTNSWLGAFQDTEPALLDPLSTSPGAAALLAIQAERAKTSASDSQVANVLVPLAQRLGSMAKAYTDVNGLFGRAAADGSNMVVPATEQSFVAYQEAHPDSLLKAVVPQTGTMVLDYPLVVTAKSNTEVVTEAAKALAAQVINDGAAALDQAGFRDSLLSQLSGGRGVGDITQLTKPTAQVVDKMLQQWSKLSLSAHSLAVIDVSGSMNEKVGNKTRMQLTVEAAEGGLKLFPDSAALGLWAFSTKLSGSADWKPLVPIHKLTAQQRQQIVSQLQATHARIGGGTGLYDTAIAAVRTVRDSYDPTAVNSVMLFTDGKNDDPGNSLSLDQAVQALEALRDPARPVRIIALGIGPDVNEAELAKLAQATGGSSYVATNPGELKNVFINALENR